ncbi:unnamed protein product [Urochloa humidicola]
MALESEGGGGAAAARAKRQRVDEQAGHRKDVAPGSEETPAGHISALPDDLRRRILTHLPLKDAIRTGALAQGWRDLWKSRWADPTSCRDIHLLPGDKPRKVLESLESVPRRRLDRFSFVSDYEKLRQPYLKRFLAYAAGCRVEDLRVDLSRCHWRLTFHLPLSSPLLAHLSLRSVDMCHMYYKGARPFYALESIHLHSVSCSVKFSKEALPRDLSGLSVLTISSNAVRIACSVFNMTETSYWTKMNNLRSLRELQLLILGMENDMDNLANIYLFLKACRCSNLERLFVQLPATSDVPLEDLVGEPQVLPPEDVLAKLRMVKVMNFNWRLFEVQLVSLLLRKATSLHKLLLVSPNVNPQYVPGVQEADLLLLKEALASGRIIVSKSDDPATQPFHSEVFIKI